MSLESDSVALRNGRDVFLKRTPEKRWLHPNSPLGWEDFLPLDEAKRWYIDRDGALSTQVSYQLLRQREVPVSWPVHKLPVNDQQGTRDFAQSASKVDYFSKKLLKSYSPAEGPRYILAWSERQ